MIAILERCKIKSLWGCIYNWITSTKNRLHIGQFGVLMIPTLLTATSILMVFVNFCESLLTRNNIIYGDIIPTSVTIAFYFYPIWKIVFVNEWLYKSDPFELIVLHFLLGVTFYIDCEWEPGFRLDKRPWIVVLYSAPIVAATAIFLNYPRSRGSFSD
ncbi:Photosystem II protein D1, partial [Mucuna pruriens]